MSLMPRVRLVHWDVERAQLTRGVLRKAGLEVEYDEQVNSAVLRQCRENPPAVFVIDLSRKPSHGREVAIALRQSPKTRKIPIVFCDGEPEKVKLVRNVLPDATYCTSERLRKALKQVRPLPSPVKPPGMMDRYSMRTTAQKLGIKVGTTVSLLDPPPNINRALGELPEGVEFVEERGAVTLCFMHSLSSLPADAARLRELASGTKLWILWRKKGAPGHDGITDRLIRNIGFELGLVDYKVCSIDKTWSAMLFAQRK
jgi:CheY-like chemotaxis protein